MQSIVPQSPTITLSQCEEIIRKKLKNENYKIVDYKLSNVAEKCGFLGEHCELVISVTTDENKTETVNCFAKFMPNSQTQIDFVVNSGAFKKEVFMYEVLFPKIYEAQINYLRSCIPQCYLTKQDYVIVVEDITKLNYKPLRKYCYFLDYDHVIVTLKSMAKLHASSLIFEEKYSEKLDKPFKIPDMYGEYFYETFYVDEKCHKGGQGVYASIKGLQAEADLFPSKKSKYSNEEFKSWLETATLDLFKLVKPSKKFRNVLCHGDLWTTNIMIKYAENKPQHCMLLDFQTIRYCPPAHDFMLFLYLTTSREFRSQNLEKLQRFYYSELQELMQCSGYDLKTILSFGDFIDSCNEQKRFATVLTATYVQLTQIKSEFVVDFIQDDKKWDEAMYKDRSLMVSENCKRDPNYKQILQETLEELRIIFEETHS